MDMFLVAISGSSSGSSLLLASRIIPLLNDFFTIDVILPNLYRQAWVK